jgi:hypothetical protein
MTLPDHEHAAGLALFLQNFYMRLTTSGSGTIYHPV